MAASDPSSGPRHGAHAAPRSGSWPRGRVVAVGLTVLVVGAGTWVLGASADKPATTHSGRADVHSLPAGSAPPLAVAPPPSGHGTTAAGSVRRAPDPTGAR